MTTKPVAPYGKRSGLLPRGQEDYGDGGAFPEVHVRQYPLDMGRRRDDSSADGSSNGPAPTIDGSGRAVFGALLRQLMSAKTALNGPGDVVPDDETIERTKAALKMLILARLSAAQRTSTQPPNRGPTFFRRYKRPALRPEALNSGAAGRIIRMGEIPTDPFELPRHRHRHRRFSRPMTASPPAPVLSSPPRPLSGKDQSDWRIPPCVSNWKNPKGYSIPLDKRSASDGRALQEACVNAAFAGLTEALYAAEQKARQALQMRSRVMEDIAMVEKDERDLELRWIAKRARRERTRAPPLDAKTEPSEQLKERMERDVLREDRRRERENEKRATVTGQESKVTRERDRDVTERIALGMANTGRKAGGEVDYDERLFNQDKGLDSGFTTGDQYNVYSGKAELQLEKILKTDRFKPDKRFSEAPENANGKRERPVELDGPENEDDDPFDLDHFLNQFSSLGVDDLAPLDECLRSMLRLS